MKMRIPLALAFAFASQAVALAAPAAPVPSPGHYDPNGRINLLDSTAGVGECEPAANMVFRKCVFLEKEVLAQGDIAPLLRGGAARITVTRNFNNTFGRFFLAVDGAIVGALPDGVGSIDLPLGLSANTRSEFSVVSTNVGPSFAASDFKADITDLTVTFDPTARIAAVIANAHTLSAEMGRVRESHELWSRVQKAFTRSAGSLGNIKTIQLGIPADAFPENGIYDCGAADSKHYADLDPIECQLVQEVDKALRGDSTVVPSIDGKVAEGKAYMATLLGLAREYQTFFEQASVAAVDSLEREKARFAEILQ